MFANMCNQENQDTRPMPTSYRITKYLLVALLSIQLALIVLFAALEYAEVFHCWNGHQECNDDEEKKYNFSLGIYWRMGVLAFEVIAEIVQLIIVFCECPGAVLIFAICYQMPLLIVQSNRLSKDYYPLWYLIPLVVTIPIMLLMFLLFYQAYRIRERRFHLAGIDQQRQQRAFLASIPPPDAMTAGSMAHPMAAPLVVMVPPNANLQGNNSMAQPSSGASMDNNSNSIPTVAPIVE